LKTASVGRKIFGNVEQRKERKRGPAEEKKGVIGRGEKREI